MHSRGSGITTKAIMKLPLNSIYFIWSETEYRYTRNLLRSLNREDVRLEVWQRHNSIDKVRGTARHIGVDHYVFEMSPYWPDYQVVLFEVIKVVNSKNLKEGIKNELQKR